MAKQPDKPKEVISLTINVPMDYYKAIEAEALQNKEGVSTVARRHLMASDGMTATQAKKSLGL